MAAEAKRTRPLIWAHTGDKFAAPENTLAAFRAGLEAGADGVELDVHLTADGHVVVLHDSTVDRTTDGKGPVAEKTLQEIRSLDAGSKFSAEFKAERIPTLTEVLELVLAWPGGDKRVLIELKGPVSGLTWLLRAAIMRYLPFPQANGKLVPALVNVLAPFQAAVEAGRLLAQSFHLPYLLELQVLLPQLQSLYLSPASSAGLLETADLRGSSLGLAGVAVLHLSASRAVVQALQSVQGKVFVWTPDSASAIRKATAMGVDGIITNRPALALVEMTNSDCKAIATVNLDWCFVVLLLGSMSYCVLFAFDYMRAL